MAKPFEIQKATMVDEYLRVGLAGPSTSGKTVSALRLATGMLRGTGKRIVLIDTENQRSRKYAPHFDFDHINFEAPFSSKRYLEALQHAEKAGAGAIIVDSQSHEHEGPGGMLEQHENFLREKAGDDWKRREALKFTAWIEPKAQRNKLIQHGIQRVNSHLILCFRAKEKIELRETFKDGKKKIDPVNIGWTAIGGEEFPFEMLTNIILPPRSEGRPDWSQESCTINSLDKRFIKLLKECGQITEDLGAEMVRLTRADAAPAPPASTSGTTNVQGQTVATPSPQQKIAGQIRSAIKLSDSAASLHDAWTIDYAPDLEKLKVEKVEYYNTLEGEYKARMQVLGGVAP